MKADQERVKNLLIDTVTLLCKNSLTYEDELCVEGLLGVKVDQKDVFFVHISETFPSALSVQKAQLQAAAEVTEEQPLTPSSSNKRPHHRTESPAYRDSPSSRSSSDNKINIKTEEFNSDDDACVITDPADDQTSSHLQSASSVSNAAERIAGQRRTPRSPRSPRHHQQHHHQQQQQQGDQSFQSTDSLGYQDYPEFSHIGKEESNGEPPRKRLAMGEGGGDEDSYGGETQWPNIAGGMDMAGHAAQAAFQDSGDSQMSAGAGDMSQPGCSSWPQGLQQATDTALLKKGSLLRVLSSLTPQNVIHRSPNSNMTSDNAPRAGLYMCPTCGRGFHNSWKLQRHEAIHTGVRFACDLCGGTYSRSDALVRHKRQAHSDPQSVSDAVLISDSTGLAKEGTGKSDGEEDRNKK